ncbi:hypothetical protein HanRHA438_Chr11g0482981 [Helianthus annuus]|nr:hypothetical protein HanHA300_Chr11g0385441 [Helianthus annuus]KAJ0515881.1 hypothetical protein HanHA89_Chr11g0407721 [Helianthus annuus]KAJ0687858.1 hypothetical protein HanOQP8_Chr11g0388051 [Helianthus annuus]KAJ0868870.1 hypothetical protein HanRHA438_Chr11g0482981 [Helianthus annuus]
MIVSMKYNSQILPIIFLENGIVRLNFHWTRQPAGRGECNKLASLQSTILSFIAGLGEDRWEWSLETSKQFFVQSLRDCIQRVIFQICALIICRTSGPWCWVNLDVTGRVRVKSVTGFF